MELEYEGIGPGSHRHHRKVSPVFDIIVLIVGISDDNAFCYDEGRPRREIHLITVCVLVVPVEAYPLTLDDQGSRLPFLCVLVPLDIEIHYAPGTDRKKDQ